jgi:hypothetical protein
VRVFLRVQNMLAIPALFRFSYFVHDLQTWQKVVLLLLVPGIIAICGIIGREIYFAVHPDKRPRKRRKRPRD